MKQPAWQPWEGAWGKGATGPVTPILLGWNHTLQVIKALGTILGFTFSSPFPGSPAPRLDRWSHDSCQKPFSMNVSWTNTLIHEYVSKGNLEGQGSKRVPWVSLQVQDELRNVQWESGEQREDSRKLAAPPILPGPLSPSALNPPAPPCPVLLCPWSGLSCLLQAPSCSPGFYSALTVCMHLSLLCTQCQCFSSPYLYYVPSIFLLAFHPLYDPVFFRKS